MTDEQWGEFMYYRKNPKGLHHELWVHAAGCRQYFNVARNTQTYEIYCTYRLDEMPEFGDNPVVGPTGSALNKARQADVGIDQESGA